MAQKAYEAYGKSSLLPAFLHLPFPPRYVPPPASTGTGGSRRGTLTTWARPGDYRHMARKSSLLHPRRIVTVLASCLHLAGPRLWGPEGRRCAGKNQRTNPPQPRPPQNSQRQVRGKRGTGETGRCPGYKGGGHRKPGTWVEGAQRLPLVQTGGGRPLLEAGRQTLPARPPLPRGPPGPSGSGSRV